MTRSAVPPKGSGQPGQPTEPGRAESWHHPERLAALLGGIGLRRYSGIVLWGLFILVFALWVPETFLTRVTLTSILSAQSLTAILALAVIFPLAAGVFDLSAAQNVGSTALAVAYLIHSSPQLPPLAAALVGLGMGACVGVLNGVLVAIIGVDSFIATLATQSLLLATTEQLANGQYIGPLPTGFGQVTSPAPLGIPMITIYLVILAVIGWYVLEHTPFGRRIYATGANRESARLAGVRTTRYVFGSMVICAIGASLTGVLLASTLGTVNQTLGPQYLLPAYAAAFLGTTQIKPGRFNVWGTVLAIFLLGTGVEGLELAGGGQLYLNDYFNGVALMLAVSAAVILEKNRGRREKKRHVTGADSDLSAFIEP
jgi:ribose transport system permease protein